MSDLHEIGRAAADAAELPDFESLRLRGLRRRTVRRTAWVSAAAAAVVGVIALAQLPGGQRAQAPGPATPGPTLTSPTSGPTRTPSTAPTPSDPRDQARAATIVDDPAARLYALQVDPANPDVMAGLWQCSEAACERRGDAIALTGNGFRTRSVELVDGGGLFAALGGGAFSYRSGLGAGEIYRVPGIDLPPGGGGAVVSVGSGLHLWTLIEADGSGGPIENAEGYNQIVRTSDGGLTALGIEDSGRWVVARSTDVGATWDRQRLESAPGPIFSFIPSAGAPALLESGDGATLTPVVATWRLEDTGRWVRYAAPAGPTAYAAGQVVLPDGRLLTAVEDWWPRDAGQPGFFVSGRDDWSRSNRISDSGFPDDYRPVVLATQASRGSALMVVADPQHGYWDEGYRTTDGQTWTPVRLR